MVVREHLVHLLITKNENNLQATLHWKKTSEPCLLLLSRALGPSTVCTCICACRLVHELSSGIFSLGVKKKMTRKQTAECDRPANSPGFPRSLSSFSSNLPVSWLDYQISREIPTVAFFIFCFINFVIFLDVKNKNKTRSGFIVLI